MRVARVQRQPVLLADLGPQVLDEDALVLVTLVRKVKAQEELPEEVLVLLVLVPKRHEL